MKNIGIIGCGKIAQTRHIPEYMDNQDSRLAAFYDVNAERARFLAKKYGGRAYGTYRELLQDKEDVYKRQVWYRLLKYPWSTAFNMMAPQRLILFKRLKNVDFVVVFRCCTLTSV